MRGRTLDCGHYLPEEAPEETYAELRAPESEENQMSIFPTEILLAIAESCEASWPPRKGQRRKIMATQKATFAAGGFWNVEPGVPPGEGLPQQYLEKSGRASCAIPAPANRTSETASREA